MTRIACVFPGQGSQKVGMGLDVLEANPNLTSFYDKAAEVLGTDIKTICFEGPKEDLTQTQNAQPGIFITSVVLYELFKASGLKPELVAGHSLGELTAYYASGVYSFEDGISLIRARGNAMAKATPAGVSGMAAVMGLELDVIQKVLEPFAEAPVVPANLNCPGQIVVSGEKTALEDTFPLFKEAGGKVIPLPVSGAFHSPLMAPASEELKSVVESLSFADAEVPIVLNRLAKAESSSEALKENIPIQVISPVRWIESIQEVASQVDVIVEIGPGKVLSGLIKKINPSIKTYSVSSIETLNACVEELKG
jgi:[acyl-carrier-protein] S-malonyltransferase